MDRWTIKHENRTTTHLTPLPSSKASLCSHYRSTQVTRQNGPAAGSACSALVHDQPSLSDAGRMAHLQAAVTGRAQQAIAGMLYDGGLYHQAVSTLQDRFGRSGDIIRAHLGLFSAEPPLEYDAVSLETFQATVH